MRIYLVGMPGSGKTTLGKSLASKLKYTFVDLDERIVHTESMPISDIFSQKGEEYFRKLERSLLLATGKEDNIIIATGGGAPCFYNNMEEINRMGISLFLQIPLEQLVQRVYPGKNQTQIRPLFAEKNESEIMQTLQAMWQKRSPFYQKAHILLTSKETKADKAWHKVQDYINGKALNSGHSYK
jgi:shikimate kinase